MDQAQLLDTIRYQYQRLQNADVDSIGGFAYIAVRDNQAAFASLMAKLDAGDTALTKKEYACAEYLLEHAYAKGQTGFIPAVPFSKLRYDLRRRQVKRNLKGFTLIPARSPLVEPAPSIAKPTLSSELDLPASPASSAAAPDHSLEL